MSDDPNIIAVWARERDILARSRLLSRAGRFRLVPSTTLSPSVRRGYALRARWGYLAHASPPQTAAAAGAWAVAWMATGSVAAERDGGSGTSGNERRHGRRRQQWGGAWPWENTRQGVRAGQCGVGRRFGGLTLMFRQEMDVRGNSLKLVWINPRGPAATRSTTPRWLMAW